MTRQARGAFSVAIRLSRVACCAALLTACHGGPPSRTGQLAWSGRIKPLIAYHIVQAGREHGLQYWRCVGPGCPAPTVKTAVSELPVPVEFGETGSATSARIVKGAAERDVYVVYFASGSASLTERARRELAAMPGTGPGTRLLVAGRTDNVGSDALNTRLAQARADSVASYLRSRPGYSRVAIDIDARARCCDAMDNATEAGRQANRRAEISALSSDGVVP